MWTYSHGQRLCGYCQIRSIARTAFFNFFRPFIRRNSDLPQPSVPYAFTRWQTNALDDAQRPGVPALNHFDMQCNLLIVALRPDWRSVVSDPSASRVELSEAIEALRNALVAAWWDSQGQRVRFKVEPVELTLQVGVTQSGRGAAGIRWHVLSLGGERSRDATSTQTLKLRLAPVLFDASGNVLAAAEQLISGTDSAAQAGKDDGPSHEPA